MDSVSRGWCILLVAGLTEVVWATAMGLSDGFREWEWTLVTAVFLTISTWLLSKALEHGLLVGGAYATWVGIGALGTVAVSSLIGMEHLSAGSLLFVLMVAVGVIGLLLGGIIGILVYHTPARFTFSRLDGAWNRGPCFLGRHAAFLYIAHMVVIPCFLAVCAGAASLF